MNNNKMLIFWHLKGCAIMANTNMAEEQNTEAKEVFDSLNGTQKCAILMLLIGSTEEHQQSKQPKLMRMARISSSPNA